MSLIIFFFFFLKKNISASYFRHYKEKVFHNFSQKRLRWIPPSHWIQYPNEKMRSANFKVPCFLGNAICSITFLPLEAADLVLNVRRWAQQIALSISEREILLFINNSVERMNKNQINYRLLNFNKIVHKKKAPSISVAIFSLRQKILFVKLTGFQSQIEQSHSDFLNFLNTFRFE